MNPGRLIRCGLLGLLAGFELFVGILILFPQVPEQFRAYYIDRSTDCWPFEVSGAYRLGATVSFVRPASPGIGNLKVCGWLDPEDTGTWSIGPEARLRFRVPPPVADLLLELDMLAFVATGLPEQVVNLTVNGSPLETLRLGPVSSGKKYFRIPRALVLENWGVVELWMQFPTARSPASLGINNDQRRLAVRLRSVRLTLARSPAPPAQR